MNLREAIAALAEVEAGVEFDSGISGAPTKIARVYPLVPRTGRMPVDLPCFMNTWTWRATSRRPNNQLMSTYVIRPQVLVSKIEIDADQWALVATAIHDAFLARLDANLGLGAGQTYLRETRGADPTLTELMWNGQGYVGLDYEFEADLYQVSLFALGA